MTNTAVDAEIGRAVRMARDARLKTDQELADRLDLSLKEYQGRDSGEARFSPDELFVLASVLGVPIKFFFDGLSLRPK